MDPFYTNSPVVRRNIQQFHGFVTIGGENRAIPFEREVLWLQGSEAQIVFVHGGQVLAKEGTRNDFYGYLTSAVYAIGEAEKLCHHFSVTPESSLEVQVVVTVFQEPVIETDQTREHNQTKPETRKAQYVRIPTDWCTKTPQGSEIPWARLQHIDLDTMVIWSSKGPGDANLARLAALQGKYQVVDTPAVLVVGE